MHPQHLLVPVTGFGPFDPLAEAAHQLYIEGWSDRAVYACREGLAFVRLTDDRDTEYYLRYTLSTALNWLGRYRAAADEAGALLHVLDGHPSPYWRAKAMALLAETSIADGEVGPGLDALAEAYSLVDTGPAAEYNHMAAVMAVALALSPALLFEKADELLRAAMAASVLHGPDFRVLVAQEATLLRVTWGVALELIGDEPAAHRHYAAAMSRALRMRREASARGDHQMVARAEVMEGFAMLRLDPGGPAEHRILSAIRGFEQRPELNETQMALIGQAIVAGDRGEFAQARAALHEVMVVPDQPNRYVWQSMALAVMAQVDQRELGEHPAVDHWREIARASMRRMWSERENRFSALRDRIAVRRLTQDAARMHRQALEDPLTGLGNRRVLEAALSGEKRSRALIFVDIDNFKDVNDLFSHEAGDLVLRRVADILRSHCRADDVVIRYGGDEFLALLSGDQDAATGLAHRIHQAVQQENWAAVAAGLRVTVSVGVAGRAPGHTLLATADAALYAAKRTDGDRVVIA